MLMSTYEFPSTWLFNHFIHPDVCMFSSRFKPDLVTSRLCGFNTDPDVERVGELMFDVMQVVWPDVLFSQMTLPPDLFSCILTISRFARSGPFAISPCRNLTTQGLWCEIMSSN